MLVEKDWSGKIEVCESRDDDRSVQVIMGGSTGVRRDVLRWLVALNLSIPIKNIKRDFSNGFLVAEIFSRFFPHDIQMHSYDYGTKLERKRDNWAQLQKFFRVRILVQGEDLTRDSSKGLQKRSFVVLKDEIENIITCATPDGAGPLLERMYKFLTQKQCKPEDGQAVQQWMGHPESSEPPGPVSMMTNISQVPQATGAEVYVNGSSNLNSSTFSAMNNVVERATCTCICIKQGTSLAPCFNPNCQHFISVSNSYYSVEREILNKSVSQENGTGGVLSHGSEGRCSINAGGSCFNKDDENSPPHSPPERIDNREKNQKKMSLTAVERARQRETSQFVKGRPKNTIHDHSGPKSGNELSSDVNLAFRSPHRKRHFKHYTLNDYRRQQTGVYVQLGTLGPHLDDGELGEKKEKLERMKEFGRLVRTCNTAQVSAPKKPKTPPMSKRKKALDFAATVPKPKKKEPVQEERPHSPVPEKSHHCLSELQLLEAKHEADKQHVEAIRRELELFLR